MESGLFTLDLDEDDNVQNRDDQYVQEHSQNWSSTRKETNLKKKRGAPFKGTVSDNNEEKFKVQR